MSLHCSAAWVCLQNGGGCFLPDYPSPVLLKSNLSAIDCSYVLLLYWVFTNAVPLTVNTDMGSSGMTLICLSFFDCQAEYLVKPNADFEFSLGSHGQSSYKPSACCWKSHPGREHLLFYRILDDLRFFSTISIRILDMLISDLDNYDTNRSDDRPIQGRRDCSDAVESTVIFTARSAQNLEVNQISQFQLSKKTTFRAIWS